MSAAPRPQWAEALGVTTDGLARLSAALRSNVARLSEGLAAAGDGDCHERAEHASRPYGKAGTVAVRSAKRTATL